MENLQAEGSKVARTLQKWHRHKNERHTNGWRMKGWNSAGGENTFPGASLWLEKPSFGERDWNLRWAPDSPDSRPISRLSVSSHWHFLFVLFFYLSVSLVSRCSNGSSAPLGAELEFLSVALRAETRLFDLSGPSVSQLQQQPAAAAEAASTTPSLQATPRPTSSLTEDIFSRR